MKPEYVTELVQLRLEQAREALLDARFLRDAGRTEQSVINRSYYAMFYAGLALLQTIGRTPSKHTGVISLFDTEFVLKDVFPKQLSKDFHKAFNSRQSSDYQPGASATREEAVTLLETAENFVEQLEKYLKEELSLDSPSGA